MIHQWVSRLEASDKTCCKKTGAEDWVSVRRSDHPMMLVMNGRIRRIAMAVFTHLENIVNMVVHFITQCGEYSTVVLVDKPIVEAH